MNYYKTDDGVLYAKTEKVFAKRIREIPTQKRYQEQEISEAIENWKCLDFAKFFDAIYDEYGEGTYQLNVTTHQEIMINDDQMNENFLAAIEGTCELKTQSENFYLSNILDVQCSVYIVQTQEYLTLDEWKQIVENNSDIQEETKETLYQMMNKLEKVAQKEFTNVNVIHHMPVWDIVSAIKL